jgi:hypothetical protein
LLDTAGCTMSSPFIHFFWRAFGTFLDLYHRSSASLAMLNAQPPTPTPLPPSSSSSGPANAQWPSPLTPQYYLAEMATPEEIAVVVTADDFAAALCDLVPSVSQAEMVRYAQIRERFSQSSNAANTDMEDLDGVAVGRDKQSFITDTKGKGKSS